MHDSCNNWGESERAPHVDELNVCNLYILMVRPSPVCRYRKMYRSVHYIYNSTLRPHEKRLRVLLTTWLSFEGMRTKERFADQKSRS